MNELKIRILKNFEQTQCQLSYQSKFKFCDLVMRCCQVPANNKILVNIVCFKNRAYNNEILLLVRNKILYSRV